jgi:hypothetical protein
MKRLGMQIEWTEGAIRNLLKTNERPTAANDNAETRRTRRCRRGTQYPTPPVFCEKRLQTIENKGREMQKREARDFKRLQAIEALRVG